MDDEGDFIYPKYWLEEIPDPTAQLKADKAELLEALENANYLIKSIKNDCSDSDLREYYDICMKIESKNQSLIQKHKQ